MEKFKSGKIASELLGVHQRTLHYWDKHGKIETIRTPGGKRMYNVDKYLEEHKENSNLINTNIDNTDSNLDYLDSITTKL